MKSYPKIETLFKRDKDTFKITDQVRCPEFENIKRWLITEKIDGTNIRVIYCQGVTDTQNNEDLRESLCFRGKTDKAQMPSFLLTKLQEMFSIEKMRLQFTKAKIVCLYGEGYGARIQKAGGNYREEVSFRLIDVWIDGWWIKWDNIVDIAESLDIKTVPNLGIYELSQVANLVSNNKYIKFFSKVAEEENNRADILAEGIVARSHPLVLFRNGNPVVWKLKQKDF